MIVAKYKFNPNTYANLLPEFNSEFTDYTTSDVNNEDGTITRTIESESLPTSMRFGETTDTSTNRSKCLLEILDMNTSNIIDMSNMFRSCPNLTNITCNWDTSNVTNTGSMFNRCSSLTSLDVSNFDTSQVTNMNAMFYNCSSLTFLDLNNWDTSKVTNISSMFNGCSSLASLDVSNWNTSNVTDMGNMFTSCSKLTSLDVSNWDTSKVTNMYQMFYHCSSLTQLDVSKWNTSNVTTMSLMFTGSSLISLDLSNWNTSNVTTMRRMFGSSTKLASLDISNWDTSNVTYVEEILNECISLRKIKIVNATIPQLTDMLPIRASDSLGYLFSPTLIPNDKNWNTIITYTGYNITIKTSQPLGKNDKLYWSSSNNRFEIDRNGVVEVPTVEGDIVDLPRLYQKEDTTINISTDNIKPSKIAIEYKDINNN